MSRFINGNFYHIYNRGNSKQEIFHDEEDYERFRKFLYLSNTKKRMKFREDIVKKKIDAYDFDRGELLVDVCMYVLMPNHFHLCLTPATKQVGDDSVDKYMQKLEGAYVRYYNAKYKRSGSLFESRFKSELLDNDQYLKYIFSYIHLNPVKLLQKDWKEKGIKNLSRAWDFLDKFAYSSLSDYRGVNKNKYFRILNEKVLLKVLPKNFNPRKELIEWLNYK